MRRLSYGFAAALSLSVLAVPVHGQGTESYKFLSAVRERDGTKVDQMLASTVNPVNTKDLGTGDTALHIVAGKRDLDWLRFLMSKGARVDIHNREGNTPLIVAAQIGWLEGADALLARQAKVDASNSRGETALIVAVQRRDLAMVRLLMSEGADPTRPDRIAGYSALDYAKRDPRSAAILKLLEATATPKKKVQGPGL